MYKFIGFSYKHTLNMVFFWLIALAINQIPFNFIVKIMRGVATKCVSVFGYSHNDSKYYHYTAVYWLSQDQYHTFIT